MLPKNRRITTPLFKEVLKNGKRVHGDYTTVRYLKAETGRFSVVVPTSVSKKAVDRNKLRRQVRAALEKQTLPSVYAIIFLKKDATHASQQALKTDIVSLLNRLH